MRFPIEYLLSEKEIKKFYKVPLVDKKYKECFMDNHYDFNGFKTCLYLRLGRHYGINFFDHEKNIEGWKYFVEFALDIAEFKYLLKNELINLNNIFSKIELRFFKFSITMNSNDYNYSNYLLIKAKNKEIKEFIKTKVPKLVAISKIV